MKIGKKIISLLLGAALILSLSACGQRGNVPPERTVDYDFSYGLKPADGKNELTKISENDRFILYANLKRGEAAVEDKKTGRTWYSNPEDKMDDAKASGFYKNSLLSVLTVVYNTTQNVEMTCGGYMSSVTKDGLYYRIEDDGSIIFLFDFIKEEFQIPLRFAIEDDHFSAQILTSGIVEYGTNTIKSISLLPFFGAGGRDKDGYMLVPDGSGALIYYNNERLEASTFSKALYGFDSGTSDRQIGGSALSIFTVLSENAPLPVFGANQGDHGYLAVISQGSARATISADVAGKYTSYNTVWSAYSFRTMGTVRQIQKDGSDLAVTVAEKTLETWQDYEVDYYFLDGGKASYADMAAKYRSLLLEEGGLAKRVEGGDIPLYLDLYGYIRKQKSFLGLPVQAGITMTSFADAEALLDTLEEGGVSSVVMKYSYWARNTFFDRIPLVTDPDSRVGTKTELSALAKRLEESGGELYLGADLLNIYKTGRGITQTDGVLQSVANTVQRQYAFRRDTAMTDSRYTPWYLLRPTLIRETYAGFLEDLAKAGYTRLAADGLGSMLYSELGTGGTGRSQALLNVRETAKDLSEGLDGLLLDGANGYAAAYATHVIGAPAGCSRYDLEDESVPFWQLVFHGYVSYSLPAMNHSSSPSAYLLTALEYGAAPLYSLVGENADELLSSRMDTLYSADSANWTGVMAAQYRQLNTALKEAKTSAMTGHEILSDGLRRTDYENGLTVFVNYGNTAVSADGLEIPALGFTAVKDGNVLISEAAVSGF